MVREQSLIEADVVLLSKENGGRSNSIQPVAYKGGYRPHIVLQDRSIREAKIELRDGRKWGAENYLGVAFWSGPDPVPIDSPFY